MSIKSCIHFKNGLTSVLKVGILNTSIKVFRYIKLPKLKQIKMSLVESKEKKIKI